MTPHDIHVGLAQEKWDRRAAAWINKHLAAASAQSADQCAPKGAQADGVVVNEHVPAAVAAKGPITLFATH